MNNTKTVLVVGLIPKLNDVLSVCKHDSIHVVHTPMLEKNCPLKTYDVIITRLANYIDNARSFFSYFKKTAIIIVADSLSEIDINHQSLRYVEDVLIFPLEKEEFVVRIMLAINRSLGRESNATTGGLRLERGTFSVSAGNANICLTSSEFFILETLIKHKGNLVLKSELAEKILCRRYLENDRRIDVHISRIRKKLRGLVQFNMEIKTVRGQGYMLCE